MKYLYEDLDFYCLFCKKKIGILTEFDLTQPVECPHCEKIIKVPTSVINFVRTLKKKDKEK